MKWSRDNFHTRIAKLCRKYLQVTIRPMIRWLEVERLPTLFERIVAEYQSERPEIWKHALA